MEHLIIWNRLRQAYRLPGFAVSRVYRVKASVKESGLASVAVHDAKGNVRAAIGTSAESEAFIETWGGR